MSDARILFEIPIASTAGTGSRLVVQSVDAPDIHHVVCRNSPEDRLRMEATFTLASARETAMRVLAGDPRTATAHETLRTLAAAVVLLVPEDAYAAPIIDGAAERG